MENKIQFAVVREDPETELRLIRERNLKNILLIASGGCSGLSIKSILPEVSLTFLDPNLDQLDLIKDKIRHLMKPSPPELFNIESDNCNGLNACGNFESLFRGFREFIYEMVMDQNQILLLFQDPSCNKGKVLDSMFRNKYWRVAFDMYFCDSLLDSMFGTEATQNAPRRSYPRYFQSVLERGLQLESAYNNYFLHHIFLGHYLNRPDSLPLYLQKYLGSEIKELEFSFFHGYVEDFEHLSQYDFVDLSNIFDWMAESQKIQLSRKLVKETKTGCTLLIRQLNNQKDVKSLFEPVFAFDESLEKTLWEKERSLFYTQFNVGLKN